MSYCRKEGKDTIIFATKKNHQVPSKVTLPEPERPPGVILPDGSINWNCPCLGGMATGPCGLEFREAFSCFHYSKADPKGSDCLASFSNMQDCMKHYPSLYASHSVGDDELLDDDKYLDELQADLERESHQTKEKIVAVFDKKSGSGNDNGSEDDDGDSKPNISQNEIK